MITYYCPLTGISTEEYLPIDLSIERIHPVVNLPTKKLIEIATQALELPTDDIYLTRMLFVGLLHSQNLLKHTKHPLSISTIEAVVLLPKLIKFVSWFSTQSATTKLSFPRYSPQDTNPEKLFTYINLLGDLLSNFTKKVVDESYLLTEEAISYLNVRATKIQTKLSNNSKLSKVEATNLMRLVYDDSTSNVEFEAGIHLLSLTPKELSAMGYKACDVQWLMEDVAQLDINLAIHTEVQEYLRTLEGKLTYEFADLSDLDFGSLDFGILDTAPTTLPQPTQVDFGILDTPTQVDAPVPTTPIQPPIQPTTPTPVPPTPSPQADLQSALARLRAKLGQPTPTSTPTTQAED